MRSVLVLCMLAASFAAFPTAAAGGCDPTFTVCEGSSRVGDCSNGHESNFLAVSTLVAIVTVGTYCSTAPGIFSGQGVHVNFLGPTGAGYFDWSSYTMNGASHCSADVHDETAGDVPLPLCDFLGEPPMVPAVLP